jgi:hypothetical protein
VIIASAWTTGRVRTYIGRGRDELSADIVGAGVSRYEIASIGPA